MPTPTRAKITSTMLELLAERGTATACPSDVARALSTDNWRPLMQRVREVAAVLQDREQVDVYQRGRPVKALEAVGPIRLRRRSVGAIDYRKNPEAYRVGKGEQGVLTVEPYKSELIALWRFKTPAEARTSSKALWAKFVGYRRARDFVGMDMARKFLQMGWTRARRYANHPGGRKYAKGTRHELPRVEDPVKAESAAIFRTVYERTLKDPVYRRLRLHSV